MKFPISKKKKTFSRIFFLQNKKVQTLILTLLKNISKGFLLLKHSSKTDHLSQNCWCWTGLFVSPKLFFKSVLFNVVGNSNTVENTDYRKLPSLHKKWSFPLWISSVKEICTYDKLCKKLKGSSFCREFAQNF